MTDKTLLLVYKSILHDSFFTFADMQRRFVGEQWASQAGFIAVTSVRQAGEGLVAELSALAIPPVRRDKLCCIKN